MILYDKKKLVAEVYYHNVLIKVYNKGAHFFAVSKKYKTEIYPTFEEALDKIKDQIDLKS